MSIPPAWRGLVTVGNARSWAVFSPDERYRYMLARMWDPYEDPDDATRPLLVWIMLNPSTADALQDDPTIRRCLGFARRDRQYGGIVVVNAFAYRTSDPKNLVAANRAGVDVVGPENDAVISIACNDPLLATVVAGWGCCPASVRHRVTRVKSIPMRPIHCVGLTKAGEPRHPLYVRAEAPILTIRQTQDGQTT